MGADWERLTCGSADVVNLRVLCGLLLNQNAGQRISQRPFARELTQINANGKPDTNTEKNHDRFGDGRALMTITLHLLAHVAVILPNVKDEPWSLALAPC